MGKPTTRYFVVNVYGDWGVEKIARGMVSHITNFIGREGRGPHLKQMQLIGGFC
jgi:hypothetical protein